MDQQDTVSAEALFNRRFLAYFAVGLVLASFIYIGCITFITVPKENQRFADTVLGFLLGTLLGTLISFFYGSSKSSQAKDVLIGNVATNNVLAAPNVPGPNMPGTPVDFAAPPSDRVSQP
jgi:hypothetical protein